jgi:hypothetical protein
MLSVILPIRADYLLYLGEANHKWCVPSARVTYKVIDKLYEDFPCLDDLS